MMTTTHARMYGKKRYVRATKRITLNQAKEFAKKLRGSGKYLARVDTFLDGYAVWVQEISESVWTKDGKKMPEGYNPLAEGGTIGGTYSLATKPKRKSRGRIVVPYSCPECGAEIGRTKDYEIHSGGRIECLECGTIFAGKKQSARKMKPLNIKVKKAKFRPLSSKKQAFKILDRSNRRRKSWGPRLNLVNVSAKWTAPNGEKYEAEILLQYYNDYFEYGLEGKEALDKSAYQVLFAIKSQGEWSSTNTMHVDPKYGSALIDFNAAKVILREVHKRSRSQESSDIHDFLWQHYYELWSQNEWDKFE